MNDDQGLQEGKNRLMTFSDMIMISLSCDRNVLRRCMALRPTFKCYIFSDHITDSHVHTPDTQANKNLPLVVGSTDAAVVLSVFHVVQLRGGGHPPSTERRSCDTSESLF